MASKSVGVHGSWTFASNHAICLDECFTELSSELSEGGTTTVNGEAVGIGKVKVSDDDRNIDATGRTAIACFIHTWPDPAMMSLSCVALAGSHRK